MIRHCNKITMNSIPLISSIIDFVFPPSCPICNEGINGQEIICPSCYNELKNTIHIKIQEHQHDFHYLTEEIHFDAIISCWEYSDLLEKVIRAVKYRRGTRLGRYMGRMAGEAMAGHLRPNTDCLLIPVPLHRSRYRERGYNQSEKIAAGLSESLSLSQIPKWLKRKKRTATQTKLSAEERQDNVHDAFSVRFPQKIEGSIVCLVDDVVTTGATMNSCARILKEAGASQVMGFALIRPGLEHQIL